MKLSTYLKIGLGFFILIIFSPLLIMWMHFYANSNYDSSPALDGYYQADSIIASFKTGLTENALRHKLKNVGIANYLLSGKKIRNTTFDMMCLCEGDTIALYVYVIESRDSLYSLIDGSILKLYGMEGKIPNDKKEYEILRKKYQKCYENQILSKLK